MLRLRFSLGLVIGIFIGLPAGAFIALLAFPRGGSDGGNATSLQVQDLTRKLDAANTDRARVDRQLEQFQKLTEQLTASFNALEVRFRGLAEERQREIPPAATPARAIQPAGKTPVPDLEAAPAPLHDEPVPDAP